MNIQKGGDKLIFCIALIFVIYFGFAFLFPGRFSSSEGSHTGVVTAVEHNSNILWGANIVYFKTVRESSQENRYCVNDEAVKNQLIQSQVSKRDVTVYFKNDFVMWKWQCNGGSSIIYKVE